MGPNMLHGSPVCALISLGIYFGVSQGTSSKDRIVLMTCITFCYFRLGPNSQSEDDSH